MKKLTNTEAELKKSVAYKKVCIASMIKLSSKYLGKVLTIRPVVNYKHFAEFSMSVK